MAAEKRPASNVFGNSSQVVVKRQRSTTELGDGSASVAVVNSNAADGALIQAVSRKSGLSAPVMELSGHTGEVFTMRFDPAGEVIASGSMDRTIMLWRAQGDCQNYGQLTGHKGAILDLQWSHDSRSIYSVSADTTLGSWDLETGQRIRKHVGHEEIVNALEISRRGEEMLLSASDDGSIGMWDPRQKLAIDHIETEYPVTAVALAEAGNEIYSGSIDNEIKVWDIRKKAVLYALVGHADTVTSLEVSPDAQSLLSNSHDGTVRSWDIKPFAPADRLKKTYDGATAGIEKNLMRASWHPDSQLIAAGSADRTVVVWDVRSGRLMYKLPGHKGTVNDVRFSPSNEPILASCSSDRNLILGELGR